jgi:Fe-S cluster assembly ATP-binding protein
MLLSIKDLHVEIDNKEIIRGLNLDVNSGEVHAIMGPNGTGKSTLAAAIAGKEGYTITQGEILYNGKDITEMEPETRAQEGIFLGFQYPVEIPGVSITNFMRTAMNEIRNYHGQDPLSAAEFLKKMNEKQKMLDITSKLRNRSVNEGFSGGEKKKNEIFQMAMLEPHLAILDETDSGIGY